MHLLVRTHANERRAVRIKRLAELDARAAVLEAEEKERRKKAREPPLEVKFGGVEEAEIAGPGEAGEEAG